MYLYSNSMTLFFIVVFKPIGWDTNFLTEVAWCATPKSMYLLFLILFYTLSFHHQDFLSLGPKPQILPMSLVLLILIPSAFLSYISFALPHGSSKLPSKMLGWKILCFSPFKCHRLIRETLLWPFLSALLLTLTFPYSILCWVVKLSSGMSFTVQQNLSFWLLS